MCVSMAGKLGSGEVLAVAICAWSQGGQEATRVRGGMWLWAVGSGRQAGKQGYSYTSMPSSTSLTCTFISPAGNSHRVVKARGSAQFNSGFMMIQKFSS
jgi:hypothetical protein